MLSARLFYQVVALPGRNAAAAMAMQPDPANKAPE